jgi:hypothetical protein
MQYKSTNRSVHHLFHADETRDALGVKPVWRRLAGLRWPERRILLERKDLDREGRQIFLPAIVAVVVENAFSCPVEAGGLIAFRLFPPGKDTGSIGAGFFYS